MPLSADTVYVMPSEQLLTVRSDHFVVSDYDNSAQNHYADLFFRALADEAGERSVAVFFSGSQLDGAGAVSRIRECGGIVMLLDKHDADSSALHKWFYSNDAADFVLSAPLLAEELGRLADLNTKISIEQSDLESFKLIYSTLKGAIGIDFSHYKHNIVTNAVKRHMAVTNFIRLTDYADFLCNQKSETLKLSKAILIGVTRFFRDGRSFEKLKATALRRIVCDTPPGALIRIWSAGCSTGEEAYSIAILVDELMQQTGQLRPVKIFATDANSQAVAKAARGVFGDNIVANVSPERLKKYFLHIDGKYRIDERIRKMITFAPHDLLRDPPFRNLDLIICRNVLIYFQASEQNTLFSLFHAALKPGGYLFLGRSEGADEYKTVFKAISACDRIFAHVSDEKASEAMYLPAFGSERVSARSEGVVSNLRRKDPFFSNVYTRFLERFLPASLVVDADDSIVHFFGGINDYLTIVPGTPSFKLFNLINKDLKLVVATALSRSRSNRTAVVYDGVRICGAEGDREISVSVYPIPDSGQRELSAVIFSEGNTQQCIGTAEKYDIDEAALRRITDLELELYNSRKETEARIRELEIVNEELQASNEELQTSNEELHSFNLDLQSSKEELKTFLSQYQDHYSELSLRNGKFAECLIAIETGILIADLQFNIRYISKFLAQEFNLFDQDIGRSVRIFAMAFPNHDLVEDARNVLQTLRSFESLVQAQNGGSYRVRIACRCNAMNDPEEIVFTVVKLAQ